MALPYGRQLSRFLFLFLYFFQRNVIGYSDDKLIHIAIVADLACFSATNQRPS